MQQLTFYCVYQWVALIQIQFLNQKIFYFVLHISSPQHQLSFHMKNFLLKTIIILLFSSPIFAEVIDVRNEEKIFGDWRVYCEIDDMMSYSHCKIASKFFDNSSVITLQPFAKFANQFFIIINRNICVRFIGKETLFFLQSNLNFFFKKES